MRVTAAFTLEILTAHRAHHMLCAFDFMDEMALLILEVHIALGAVVVLRESRFMLLHVLFGLEVEVAAIECAGNTLFVVVVFGVGVGDGVGVGVCFAAGLFHIDLACC
jgi:hypothetical protein